MCFSSPPCLVPDPANSVFNQFFTSVLYGEKYRPLSSFTFCYCLQFRSKYSRTPSVYIHFARVKNPYHVFASLPKDRCIHRISHNANSDISDDYEKCGSVTGEYWPVLLDKPNGQISTKTNKKITTKLNNLHLSTNKPSGVTNQMKD